MATIKLPGRSTLDMDSRKIERVAAGTADGDAVNYGQIKDLGAGVDIDNTSTVPGPVIYDQTNDQYFVETNGDFGLGHLTTLTH